MRWGGLLLDGFTKGKLQAEDGARKESVKGRAQTVGNSCLTQMELTGSLLASQGFAVLFGQELMINDYRLPFPMGNNCGFDLAVRFAFYASVTQASMTCMHYYTNRSSSCIKDVRCKPDSISLRRKRTRS